MVKVLNIISLSLSLLFVNATLAEFLPNVDKLVMDEQNIYSGSDLFLNVDVTLPKGMKINLKAPSKLSAYLSDKILISEPLKQQKLELIIPKEEVATFNGDDEIKIQAIIFFCKETDVEGGAGQCKIKSFESIVPINILPTEGDKKQIISLPLVVR